MRKRVDDDDELRIVHVDFSEFHDLMHRPFGAYCRSRPGGWRRHLELWWKYIGEPALRRQTMCRVDRHEGSTRTDMLSKETYRACWFCGERLGQEE